jgi:uncharacterized protein
MRPEKFRPATFSNHHPFSRPGAVVAWLMMFATLGDAAAPPGANLALVATSSTSYVSGHETIAALNDGFTPAHSDDKTHGAYGNWPRRGTQWVQYEWSQPISTGAIEVYWFDDGRGVRLPNACRLLYWDGSNFVPVPGAKGFGLEKNQFNLTTFPDVTTSRLRLEFDGREDFSTGLLEWRVSDSGTSPNFAPQVDAGVDRVVVVAGATYLSGAVRDDGKTRAPSSVRWSKAAGPGKVRFADDTALETAARFSARGQYTLVLTAHDGELSGTDSLQVTVDGVPPAKPLHPVWPAPWRVTGSFWSPRLKNTLIHWIPHCVARISDPKLPEGGIQNFVEAGKKLAGSTEANHVGAPFANAWVYNTLESMCLGLMLDPVGDQEILQAQNVFRETVEDWVPKILSAQEPDGYLQTMYTIRGIKRWSNRGDHEDYNAGYFIEAAIAHYLMSGRKDTRLIDAAERLADCWCNHIGPAPKRVWFGGHQEYEQALVRFARLQEERKGAGAGRKYVELAKFLLDSRREGEEYDQSHLPVTRQYEAVGHAVRAVYSYSGMADVAMETGDLDYHSAVKSLWNSIVNRKYYVTGGVGSGETSEGFGKDYSLPNHAYCESCAGCGELFFQHKMQLAQQEARYADLFEETLFNAILGGLDLEAQNFTYTNPLDSNGARYKWHVCPCCVGNIPRTLLMLPTWAYSTGKDTLYVNLYAGSEVTVPDVAGAPVRIVQATDYPWEPKLSLTVFPTRSRKFTIKLRVPDRNTSQLYRAVPTVKPAVTAMVNGQPARGQVENGYLVLRRSWSPGDRVDLQFPEAVQKVKAVSEIAATRGRVALRYGPLVYNVESVDQNIDAVMDTGATLSAVWDPKLLGGVMTVRGRWANGEPLLAIPNFARLNRGGRSIVWIKDE